MFQNLLKQNFIIIKLKDFQKLNNLQKDFLSNFFNIKEHEFLNNCLVLEKKQKFIKLKNFYFCY